MGPATLLLLSMLVRPSTPLPLLVDTSLLPPWLLTLFMLLPSLPTLSTLPLLPMPSTLPPLLPTPPTALLPTAKLLMKDCPVLVKYLIIYLFDAASVVPYYQLLICSMHINIGQLLICSIHHS